MIRAFLLRRLTDIASVALFGLDADRAAVRGLAEQVAAGWVEIGSLRLHLREARRIAHEQEDRAESAEARLVTEMRAVAHARQDVATAERDLAVEQAKAPSADDVVDARQWAPMLPLNAAMLLLRLARVKP